MWTINDFLAYRIVSGWRTHGKLAYPYCVENNKAFTLMNGGKTIRFLPSHNQYRKNIRDFLESKVKKDVTLPILSN